MEKKGSSRSVVKRTGATKQSELPATEKPMMPPSELPATDKPAIPPLQSILQYVVTVNKVAGFPIKIEKVDEATGGQAELSEEEYTQWFGYVSPAVYSDMVLAQTQLYYQSLTDYLNMLGTSNRQPLTREKEETMDPNTMALAYMQGLADGSTAVTGMDQYGGYPDAYGGYTDAMGGYTDPTGGYTDAQGGYADAMGGYTDPTGGYTDAQGGYADTMGGYTDPTGGYTDVYGGYTLPTGAYIDPITVAAYCG